MLDGFFTLPIHPAFVHFPVAMLSTTWLLLIVGYATGVERWRNLATTLEWIGLIFVPFTVLTGIRDAEGLGFLAEGDWSQPLIWHFTLSLGAAAIFAAHAIWSRRARTRGRVRMTIDLGLTSLGFWLLVMTGLVAGEMVFG